MIARNMHGYMDNYEDDWGRYIRTVCLAVILTNGGMELSFRGKGVTVFLLTVLPQLGEATAVALVAWGLYDLPIFL